MAHVARNGFETIMTMPGQSGLNRAKAREFDVTSGVSPIISPSNSYSSMKRISSLDANRIIPTVGFVLGNVCALYLGT